MTFDVVKSGLEYGGVIALVAIGYALVFGILKFINFAHGDLVTLGAYSAFVCTEYFGFDLVSATLAAALLTGLTGVCIERLAFRPLRGRRLSMFLSSFGVSLILNACVTMTFTSRTRTIVDLNSATATVDWLVGALVLGTVALAFFALTRTKYGLAVRAAAENETGAALRGIPLDRLISGVFFISSAIAGIAGVLLGVKFGLVPDLGVKYGIWAFAVVVVAGFGSVLGIVVTAIATGLIVNIILFTFGSWAYANVALFGLMTLTLLVTPHGIFGMQLRRL